MTQNELLKSLGARKASIVQDWLAEKGINDLKAFLLSKGEQKINYYGEPYFSSNIIELMRLPGLGRNSTDAIQAWALEGVDMNCMEFAHIASVGLGGKMASEVGTTEHRIYNVAKAVGASTPDELKAWIVSNQPGAKSLILKAIDGPQNIGAKSVQKIVEWADHSARGERGQLEDQAARLRLQLAEIQAKIAAL